MPSAVSSEKLQLNFLSFFEQGLLSDVTVRCNDGREIRAHKVVLASQSAWFCQQLTSSQSDKIEVPNKYKVVKALIRFMYFGGVENIAEGADRADKLTPDEGLDMLLLSEDYGVKAIDGSDILPLILPNLTVNNCLNLMAHDGLARHPMLQEGVCEFVGANLKSMMGQQYDNLLTIPRHYLAPVLRTANKHCTNVEDATQIVQFCLHLTQLDSVIDLLRETKQWPWAGEEATLLRAPAEEVGKSPEMGYEWTIDGLRGAMETTPARVVVGRFFNWQIRLDYGAEGKLRIVYESAVPEDGAAPNRCINRFPAAMFAWKVVYRGQDVFNEKPVFICFPENVSLHWSTTLPVCAADLTDDDDLKIMVNMAENPMLSLVLYYFSADLKNTVQAEDILNRLPHIEYRCLSSYSLVKTHIQE